MRSHRGFAGFAITEALIASAVLAFGLLALGTLQGTLSYSSDVSKQRAEATRLAQQKIEEMKSFAVITNTWTGSGVAAWDAIKGGNDSITTNATFNRVWTVSGSNTDPYKTGVVTLTWLDRTNKSQSLVMSTTMARSAADDSAALALLPATYVRLTKNRSLKIPVPATDLGNGTSSYSITSTKSVIFNNFTGEVIQMCTKSGSRTTCSNINAYTISGYLSGPNVPTLAAIKGMNLAGISGVNSSGSSDCTYGQAVDQNDGTLVANIYFYFCVMRPSTTGGTWNGKPLLAGIKTGYKACRYIQEATQGATDNERNNQSNNQGAAGYQDVNGSLMNQNYLVTTAACPTVPLSALHQDCTTTQLAAAQCPVNLD